MAITLQNLVFKMDIFPVFIICLAAGIFIGPYLFMTMQKKLKNKQVQNINKKIHDLYQDINAYQISIAAREKHGMDNKNFVYGEVDTTTLISILEQLKLPKDAVFYDLGSGAGKQVLAAALYHPFKKAVGVEYFEELCQVSQAKLVLLNPEKENIEFIHGDYFNIDFSDGDCFLVNATCFTKEQWAQLIDKLLAIKPGSYIIVITKSVDNSGFKLLSEATESMSWGLATTRVYQRC